MAAPRSPLDRVTRITEDFFTRIEGAGVTQPQREALLDILIVALYADGLISAEENAQLDSVIASLKWENPLQRRQYLGLAYARIRSALDRGGAGRPALLAGIATRLKDPGMRRQAQRLAADLVEADGPATDSEKAFLAEVGTACSG